MKTFFFFFLLMWIFSLASILTFKLEGVGPKHSSHTSEVSTRPLNLVPKILLHGLKVTKRTFWVGNVQICLSYFSYHVQSYPCHHCLWGSYWSWSSNFFLKSLVALVLVFLSYKPTCAKLQANCEGFAISLFSYFLFSYLFISSSCWFVAYISRFVYLYILAA